MSDAISDAEAAVPAVVLETARARVRGRLLGTIAAGLALVLLGQILLLEVLVRRPSLRLYVPDTTLLTSYSGESTR